MTLVDALLALALLVCVAVGVGAFLRWRQSRPRRHVAHEAVEPAQLGADGLGSSATLLQFSTELCARCPGVHRVLADVASQRTGVTHLDIDLTHRPDLAQQFHVLQTPTTLILNRDGVIQTRFGGAPSREVVELELDRIITEPSHA